MKPIITEEMRYRQKLCEYAKKHGVTSAARKYQTNRQFVKQYKDEKKNSEKMDLEKKALKAYLDIFDSIEEYCKVVYLVEKNTLSSLNAKEYWEKRKEITKTKIKEDLLCIDISAECYK